MSETVIFESESTKHLEEPKDVGVVVVEVLMIAMIAAEFLLRLWVAPLDRSFRVLDRIRRASVREGRDPWDEIDACGGCCCLHITGCGRRTRSNVTDADGADPGDSDSDNVTRKEVTSENFLRMQHNAYHDRSVSAVANQGCVACNTSQLRASTVDNACAARMQFLLWPGTLLDILCMIPFLLWIVDAEDIFGTSVFANFLRIFRALRVLKFVRYSPAVSILAQVIALKADTLVVAVIISATSVMLVAVAVFVAERNVNSEEYPNMVASLWWAVITLTTVGYGDVAPVTPLGRLFGAIAALLGVLFFTLPPAVISTGFVEFRETQKEQQYQKLATLITLKRRTLLRHGFMRIVRQTRNAAEIADGVFERLDVLDGSYVVAKTRKAYISLLLTQAAVRAAEAAAALQAAQAPLSSGSHPPSSPSLTPSLWNSHRGVDLHPPPFDGSDKSPAENASREPYFSLAPLAGTEGGGPGLLGDSSDSDDTGHDSKAAAAVPGGGASVHVQLTSNISVVRCDVIQAWRDVLRNPPTFSAAAVRPGCPARPVVQERLGELIEFQERRSLAAQLDSGSDSQSDGGSVEGGGRPHVVGGSASASTALKTTQYVLHAHTSAQAGTSSARASAKQGSPRRAAPVSGKAKSTSSRNTPRDTPSRPRSARQRIADSIRGVSLRAGSPFGHGPAPSLNSAAATTVLRQMSDSHQSIASLLTGRELLVTASWVFGFDALGQDLLQKLLLSSLVVAPHLAPPLGGLAVQDFNSPPRPSVPHSSQVEVASALMALPAVPRTASDGSALPMNWMAAGPHRAGRSSIFKRTSSGTNRGDTRFGSTRNIEMEMADETPRLAAQSTARVVVGGSGHMLFQSGVFGVDMVGPLERVIAPFLPTYSIRQALRTWEGSPFSPFGGALRQDDGGFIWVDAAVVGDDAELAAPAGLEGMAGMGESMGGSTSMLGGGAGGVPHALMGLTVHAREAMVDSILHLVSASTAAGGVAGGGNAQSRGGGPDAARRRLVQAADELLRAAGGDMDSALAAVLAARTAARTAGGESAAR